MRLTGWQLEQLRESHAMMERVALYFRGFVYGDGEKGTEPCVDPHALDALIKIDELRARIEVVQHLANQRGLVR